jgi:hypothetical protein
MESRKMQTFNDSPVILAGLEAYEQEVGDLLRDA